MFSTNALVPLSPLPANSVSAVIFAPHPTKYSMSISLRNLAFFYLLMFFYYYITILLNLFLSVFCTDKLYFIVLLTPLRRFVLNIRYTYFI